MKNYFLNRAKEDPADIIRREYSAAALSGVFIKKKFIWFCQLRDDIGAIRFQQRVKVSSRPNITIQECSLTTPTTKLWIPGAFSHEPITLTSYGDMGNLLYEELIDVIGHARLATLLMYTCTGDLLEKWELDVTKLDVNFADADYSDSEGVAIDIKVTYDGFKYIPGDFSKLTHK